MVERPRGDWDCVGVARETYLAKQKERLENPKPQPWIVQKLIVGVVLAIVIWTYYVYVGRMCIVLLRRGNVAKGGVYITIFNLFFLMFCWTYLKVLVTPPGFARNHVSQCEPPVSTQYGRPWEVESEVRGTDDGLHTIATPYEEMSERGHAQPTITSFSVPSQEVNPGRTSDVEACTVREIDAIPGVMALHTQMGSGGRPSGDASTTLHGSQPQALFSSQKQGASAAESEGKRRKRPEHIDRVPPQTPVLAEEYRYCTRDKLMKPMRTHHCRTCATCVLQYDHHCPWIGQCVGAYNRKFFVNFVFWSTWFTAWVFATLAAQLAADSNSGTGDLDGQVIGVIALSGLFTLFTGSLTVGHTRLLCLNATTVESLGWTRTREKDNANLGMMFHCWQWRKRIEQRKRWDKEWGRIEREGNLWWLENARTNWEQVMGHSMWEWFLPIGKSPNDGMHYPVNPRHDSDGRWRPRLQWPEELR